VGRQAKGTPEAVIAEAKKVLQMAEGARKIRFNLVHGGRETGNEVHNVSINDEKHRMELSKGYAPGGQVKEDCLGRGGECWA
jgi:hypothetical protein